MEGTELKNKLQNVVDNECKYADRNGSTNLSTCSDSSWDNDIWAHKDAIITAIRKRGYGVSCATNYGVLDITITKQITLS